MTRATGSIDPERTTIREAMQEIPGGGDVFRRFGLDTCCGGELPLANAAVHHDVGLSRLLAALDEVARASDGSGGSGPAHRTASARATGASLHAVRPVGFISPPLSS